MLLRQDKVSKGSESVVTRAKGDNYVMKHQQVLCTISDTLTTEIIAVTSQKHAVLHPVLFYIVLFQTGTKSNFDLENMWLYLYQCSTIIRFDSPKNKSFQCTQPFQNELKTKVQNALLLFRWMPTNVFLCEKMSLKALFSDNVAHSGHICFNSWTDTPGKGLLRKKECGMR